MKYDFDMVIDRSRTHSVKWDSAEKIFKAQGILPMWVADMDFTAPQPVIEALKRRAEHGIFGYSDPAPSYYESILRWMKSRHGWEFPSDWIVFSPGVVPALYNLVKMLTEPGDQVMIQSPVYPPFFHAVERNGCVIVDSPLVIRGGRYEMNFTDMEEKLASGVKVFILCNPHNPVGRVWTEEELRELLRLCRRYHVVVLSDEIHGDLIYPGHRHVPLLKVAEEGMADQVIVCTAPSKTFNLAGLQTANLMVPNPAYRSALRKVMAGGVHEPNAFGIAALEAAYTEGEPWLEQLISYLQGNLDYMEEFIRERMDKVKMFRPEGTYLVWLDFRSLKMNGEELQEFLIRECRVGLNAGYTFGPGGEGFARVNIACPRSTLQAGLERLEKGLHTIL